MVVSFIFTILYSIFIIIPTFYLVILQLSLKTETFLEKLFQVFNLQNQIKIVMFFSNLIFFIASALDNILYWVDGSQFIIMESIGGYVVGALLIIGMISLIIYWFSLIKMMDEISLYVKPSMSYFVIYLIGIIVFGFIGSFCVISFILFRLVDDSERKVFIYFLASSILIFLIVCTILIFILFILSIKMLYILYKTKINNDNILEIALKLKVRSI